MASVAAIPASPCTANSVRRRSQAIVRHVFLFVFDGFVEWEVAYALALLRTSAESRIIPIAVNPLPVVGLSGLRVTPERTTAAISLAPTDLLVLPGGERWECGPMDSVSDLLRIARRRRTWIAAIGTGVVPLAHAGLLRVVAHTSDGCEDGHAWLSARAPGYLGSEHHTSNRVEFDDHVLTAASSACGAFAIELLRRYANGAVDVSSASIDRLAMPPSRTQPPRG